MKVKYSLNGTEMEFTTKDNISFLNGYIAVKDSLAPEALLEVIPEFISNGVAADDIANNIASDNKTWEVFLSLVQHGLGDSAIAFWFQGVSDPRLNDEENVKTLINLGVKANTLVLSVLDKDQIVKHFDLLCENGLDPNLAIQKVGYYPPFYKAHRIAKLVSHGATPILISTFAFDKAQPSDEAWVHLSELCRNGLVVTEFLKEVVVKRGLALQVVVHFAKFFKKDCYVDVEAVLRDAPEDKLVVLANFSELAELGIIQNPKRVLKDWKKELGSNIVEMVLDRHGYNYGYLLEADADTNDRASDKKEGGADGIEKFLSIERA